jgi:penicillin-binding protein 2
MKEAIEQSCNCYFMEMSSRVGFDAIKTMLNEAGIGKKTGIELPENAGLCPSVEYMKKVYKQKWGAFDTAILGMGQGIILITPLQVADYMAAIANKGKVFSPRILKSIYDTQGNLITENNQTKILIDIDYSEEAFNIVREGMFNVVHGENGTGKKARSEKISVFGKTGTAELKSGTQIMKNTWMAGFAERGNEKYAYALIVENGISGGSTCAPLIKLFFDNWID